MDGGNDRVSPFGVKTQLQTMGLVVGFFHFTIIVASSCILYMGLLPNRISPSSMISSHLVGTT